MPVHSVAAERLHVIPGQSVDPAGDGAVRSAAGNSGVVLCSSSEPAQAGLYRVRVDARADELGRGVVFEVTADCRVFASRRFENAFELLLHVNRTDGLELRFVADGAPFTVSGVTIELVLSDSDPSTPETVSALARRFVLERGEADAVFRLLNRLADFGEVATAEALRATYVEDDEPLRAVAIAFRELNSPGLSALSEKARRPFTREQIAAFLDRRPLTPIDLQNLTADGRATLEQLGYRAEWLQATRLHRAYDEPQRLWRTAPDHTLQAAELTARPPLFERFAEMDRSFQWELATGRGMTAYCPVSGRRLQSTHGFCQHYASLPFLFYRFEGTEVFYVCTGHVSNAKLFIYLPRTGVIADISDTWLRQFGQAHVLGFFETNLLDCREDVPAYLNASTRPALTLGSNIHGHFIWTSMTGLQFAAENKLLDNVAEVLELDRYYFKAQELFPELADKPATRFRTAEGDVRPFAHCVRNGLLPINFTDAMVGEGLVERVRRQAAALASPAGQVPADVPRPLIFINLRAHNKVWVDQAEGSAAILNTIRQEYGAASAFLDGMPDCEALATEIRAMTHPDVPIYDGLKVSLPDTMNWAFAVDAYVSPIGSGMTLVNWLANKPGVAHAEHGHMEQMSWWNTLRPGLVDPVTPALSDIVEVGEGLYCDYKVDWRVLMDLLRPLLDRSFARHSAAA